MATPAHHHPFPQLRCGAPEERRTPPHLTPGHSLREGPNPGDPGGGRAAGGLVAQVGWVSPPAVMRFMGDAPLKGQSELDVLCTLLKVSPAPCSSALGPLPIRQPEPQDLGAKEEGAPRVGRVCKGTRPVSEWPPCTSELGG